MNTSSLQEKFPEVYKDFYAKNNLVMSWCFSLPWWPGGYGKRPNFAFTTSKINLKFHLWFTKIKEKKIIFKDITSFDITKKVFNTEIFTNVFKEEEKILNQINKDFYFDEFWLEIEILSETTRGHSFWFSWIFSAILTTWLFLLTDKISTDKLLDYDNFIKSQEFIDIFSSSIKLQQLNRYWNSIWQIILSTLYNKAWPSYLISNWIDDLNINTEYFLEKYRDRLVSSDLPFDYCMIFSGLKTETKTIESYKKAWENTLSEISNYIKNDITNDVNNYLSKFWDNTSISNNFTSNISILSAKMIMVLSRIYTSGYNIWLIEDFIDTVNQFSYAVSLMEKQSSFAEEFKYNFRKNINNSEEKLWIMPIYSWKMWGGYLVVTKFWISRENIEKTLSDLKSIYTNTQLEYSSYDDWASSNWIIVEQNIASWVFSKYIDQTKFIYKNNFWDSYIWDFVEILSKERNWLLFDMINNKIYLDSVKLTSKNICSQTTSIGVITKLLENEWKEVSNKDFPLSSYTTNKNDMVWKIVLPFIKFIEQKTWYSIPFECKWGLTDFYLKIEKVKLKIWTIDRI